MLTPAPIENYPLLLTLFAIGGHFFLFPFLGLYLRIFLLAFHLLFAYTKWRETKHHPSTASLPGRKGFFTAYVSAFHILRGNLFPMIQEMTNDKNPIHRLDLPLGNRAYVLNYLAWIKSFHMILRSSLDASDGKTDGGPIMINFMDTIGGSQIFKLLKGDFLETRATFREYTNGGVLPKKTGSLYEHVTPILDAEIDKALKESDGVVQGEALMRVFVLAALSHVLFSDYDFDNANDLGQSLEYITHTIFHRMCLMPGLVAKLDSKARASIDVMIATAKKIREKCKREAMDHPNFDPNADFRLRQQEGYDMGVVAKLYGFHTSHGFTLNDEQILDLIYLMLVAGYDTSHSFFSHVMYHAAKHPEAMEKIREDLAALTDGKFDDFDAMRKSKILYSFYLECLRMTPPSPFQSRRIINQAFELQKDPQIVLLPGDVVFLNNWRSHRDPNNYTEPDVFRADRFAHAGEDAALESNKVVKNIDTEEKKDRVHTIHPFSKGMNECPGRFTVREEGLILLIWLVRNFKLESLNDPPSRAGISFRPDGPVKVRFVRRAAGVK